jgi:hypothetical protein
MLQAASDAQRPLELKREMWSQRCRGHLAAFATEALAPRGETPARHHLRICAELEALTRREITRGIGGRAIRPRVWSRTG